MTETELIKTIEIEREGKKEKAVLVEDVLTLMLTIESQVSLFEVVGTTQQLNIIVRGWQTLKQELATKLEKIK